MKKIMKRALSFGFTNLNALFSSVSEAAFLAFSAIYLAENALDDDGQSAVKIAIAPLSVMVVVAQFDFYKNLSVKLVNNIGRICEGIITRTGISREIIVSSLKNILALPTLTLESFNDSVSVYLLVRRYNEESAFPLFSMSIIFSIFSSYSMLFLEEERQDDSKNIDAKLDRNKIIYYVEVSCGTAYGLFYFFNTMSLIDELNEENKISTEVKGWGQFSLILMIFPAFFNAKIFIRRCMKKLVQRVGDFNFSLLPALKKLYFICSTANVALAWPIFTLTFYQGLYNLIKDEEDLIMSFTAKQWLAGLGASAICPGLLLGLTAILFKEQLTDSLSPLSPPTAILFPSTGEGVLAIEDSEIEEDLGGSAAGWNGRRRPGSASGYQQPLLEAALESAGEEPVSARQGSEREENSEGSAAGWNGRRRPGSLASGYQQPLLEAAPEPAGEEPVSTRQGSEREEDSEGSTADGNGWRRERLYSVNINQQPLLEAAAKPVTSPKADAPANPTISSP